MKHKFEAAAPAPAPARHRRLPRARGGLHERAQPPRPRHDFYSEGLAGMDPGALAEARDIGGLEEEIALLRLRLRALLQEKPEDFRLVLQGINTLVRAVVAESQLAGADQQEIVRRVAEAVSQLSSLIDED